MHKQTKLKNRLVKMIENGVRTDEELAEHFGVQLATVQRHRRELELQEIRRKAKAVGVCLGSKTQPYYESEKAMQLPTYTATNRERITPIRKDWRLWT